MVQMDPTTGAIQHVANMVPDGCIGGGIWTSPAVDPSDGSIYVTTGTPHPCGTPGRAGAVDRQAESQRPGHPLELDRARVECRRSATRTSAGPRRCSPRPSTACHARSSGRINKDGLFFAWDRSNLAAGPVWQSTIADPSGSPRSIVSAAWDGKYVCTWAAAARSINGASCYGNICALDPATGAFIWRSCQDFMTAGLTEVPGILIEGVGAGGKIMFLNTANGATVLTYNAKSMVQGEVTVRTASCTCRSPTGTWSRSASRSPRVVAAPPHLLPGAALTNWAR